MAQSKILTYSTESFLNKFMQPIDVSGEMLKNDFGKFFIVKVENMIRLIRLPVPPARAINHTLIFLTEGEAIMSIGSETHRIFKNECLIVPAGQVFSFKNLDINRGYLCHFHNDIVIGKFGKNNMLKDFEFLNVWGNNMISLSNQTGEFVEHLFKRILIEYSENGLKYPDIILSNLIALLCEINHAYKPFAVSKKTNALNLANRFRELISNNITSKHFVREYADLLSITPNHLNKSVREITGKSATKWIDETLMLEAKVLLYQSNMTISEVSTEIGFMDTSYFSRFFKKHEGTTPLEFRKMIDKS